jgi:hypothetical protein
VEQPFQNFYRDTRRADGLQPLCKECNHTTAAERRAKNPEAVRQKNREWYAKNLEAARRKSREWYAKNPEAARQRNREWQAKNPEAVRQKNREWRAKNSERKLAGDRRRTYGISPEDVIALRKAQGGKCPGCQRDLTTVRECVDHDHATGKVRGLLCHRCNISLGYMEARPDDNRRLTEYLKTPPALTLAGGISIME